MLYALMLHALILFVHYCNWRSLHCIRQHVMQLHVGFWIITVLTSVLSDLFDVEFKMDLSYFAGGRCTTLSRNSMVSFSKRFQSLSLQVACRKILSLHNHVCVIDLLICTWSTLNHQKGWILLTGWSVLVD